MIFSTIDSPLTQQGSQGATHVQQYRSQIDQITRDSRNIRLSSDGHSIASGQEIRVAAIESRVKRLLTAMIEDRQISEADAGQLAWRLLVTPGRQKQDPTNLRYSPVISPQLMHSFWKLGINDAFRDDALRRLDREPNAPATTEARTEKILQTMEKMSDKDIEQFLFLYLLAFPLGGAIFMIYGPALGSRRDDKLQQGVRNEILDRHTSEVKDMLKPKTTVRVTYNKKS